MGLTRGSYEAYCLDEAVWYFGTIVEGELDKASQPKKRAKGQAQTEAARQRVFDRIFGKEQPAKQRYADPAAFFNG